MTKRYILKLEDGVWKATWTGDPGRTLDRRNAQKYSCQQDAQDALDNARHYLPFRHAKIIELGKKL